MLITSNFYIYFYKKPKNPMYSKNRFNPYTLKCNNINKIKMNLFVIFLLNTQYTIFRFKYCSYFHHFVLRSTHYNKACTRNVHERWF